MDSASFLTVEEVTERLQKNPQSIRALCRKRQLPGARKLAVSGAYSKVD